MVDGILVEERGFFSSDKKMQAMDPESCEPVGIVKHWECTLELNSWTRTFFKRNNMIFSGPHGRCLIL